MRVLHIHDGNGLGGAQHYAGFPAETIRQMMIYRNYIVCLSGVFLESLSMASESARLKFKVIFALAVWLHKYPQPRALSLVVGEYEP